MNELDRSHWEANRWIVAFRWFYLPGILLIGLIAQLNNVGLGSLRGGMIAILAISMITINLLFQTYLKLADFSNFKNKNLNFLSLLQISTELSVFSTIFILSGGLIGEGGAESIVPIMFFIPIVEAAVLFRFWGPIIVAICSSLIIGTATLILEPTLFSNLASFLGHLSDPKQVLPLSVVKTLNISIVYLIIGVFSSYISKLLKERGELLAHESINKEAQVRNLEKLNHDLAETTRALSAKEFELTSANSRLKQLEEAKTKFVSVTTHQLRTPLAAIKWTFNLLSGEGLGPLNSEQKEFVKKGADSAERMIKIVNELLNIDFVESAKDKYVFQKANLVELLETVKFEFANQAQSKKITFSIKLPVTHLPIIEIDKDKLRMALENLVDNAIKYTPENGNVSINVDDSRLNTSRPQLILKISDTGIGITERDQKKIFQKFFRAGNAVRMEPDGSGLGLYIAKEIVEKHHGTLWFDSFEGKGTDFYLTLPLNQN